LHYPGTVGSFVSSKRPRQVVTVHYDLDPAHIHSVSHLKRVYYRTLMQCTKRTASTVIVPSHTFGQSFTARWSFPPDKVRVVYHGVRAEARNLTTAQEADRLLGRFGLTPGYLLSVTNALPHKNVLCLLEAYTLLVSNFGCRAPLVLAGNISPQALREWGQRLRDRCVDIPLERVLLTGFLSPHQVGLFYQCAALMVTPTLTESSSMPVLEAMANGCPVVASDIPVHREVGGDAVVLVDANSARQLAKACARILADPVWRKTLVDRGCQQAAHYSWERTAAETMSLYQAVTKG
jgi:glycosyltransferase involved in cell wall biosynthesis